MLTYVIPIGGHPKNWEYPCSLLHKFLGKKSATFQRNGKMKVSKFYPASQAIRFHAVTASFGSVPEANRSVQYWKLEADLGGELVCIEFRVRVTLLFPLHATHPFFLFLDLS